MAFVARAFASDRRGWVTRDDYGRKGKAIRGSPTVAPRDVAGCSLRDRRRGGSRRSFGYRHVDISSRQSIPQPTAGGRWQEGRASPSRCSKAFFPFFSFPTLLNNLREKQLRYSYHINGAKTTLGLRGGPTLPYIGPTSGLREGGPT